MDHTALSLSEPAGPVSFRVPILEERAGAEEEEIRALRKTIGPGGQRTGRWSRRTAKLRARASSSPHSGSLRTLE